MLPLRRQCYAHFVLHSNYRSPDTRLLLYFYTEHNMRRIWTLKFSWHGYEFCATFSLLAAQAVVFTERFI